MTHIDNLEDYQKAVTNDFTEYLQHCKTNYLSTYNDGYTREYYRGELLKPKASIPSYLPALAIVRFLIVFTVRIP